MRSRRRSKPPSWVLAWAARCEHGDEVARAAEARVTSRDLNAAHVEDGGERPMRPVHDIESLAYTLAYLAASRLPWQGKPAALVVSTTRKGAGADSSVSGGTSSTDASFRSTSARWA